MSTMSAIVACPVCSASSPLHRNVDGYDYFDCQDCGIIFIDPATLAKIDNGESLVTYTESYWRDEIRAARERTRSTGIARLAEAIHYARRPVQRVIDIGSGTGGILDEIAKLLPNNASRFYGVEMFPPPFDRTQSKNFVVGSLKDLAPMTFDAGLCMEVVEHLTPKMVSNLLKELSAVASDNSCFLFNTGLAAFVKTEEPAYLDPLRRGHIVSWTVDAFSRLGAPFGLRATALPSRNWAFLVEKCEHEPASVESRIYHPLSENVLLLGDGEPGASLLSVLAFEAARNYYFADLAAQRTEWALSLKKELDRRPS